MSTLDVVPGPPAPGSPSPDEPIPGLLGAGVVPPAEPAPDTAPETLALQVGRPALFADGDALPTRWFDCTEPAVGARVRAHVMLALNTWAVDTDTIADAMVLVSELVGNVRDHSACEQVGVRVHVTDDRVVVAVVEDRATDGPYHRRVAPGAPDVVQVPLDVRGRGLQLIDAMASEWGFVRVDGVPTAWFALPTTPPPTVLRTPDVRRF